MTDLTRYAYDSRTGVYVGETQAHPDPMNVNRLLEPVFTTTLAPEVAPKGQVAVFANGAWGLSADHRGEVWWKGAVPTVVDFLGDPAAQGYTAEAVLPPPPPATSCSRLGLKRAFAEQGWWPTIRAMIASDSDMQEDWDLAVELRISDPIVQKAVAGLRGAGLPMSDADVLALVKRANELVA